MAKKSRCSVVRTIRRMLKPNKQELQLLVRLIVLLLEIFLKFRA